MRVTPDEETSNWRAVCGQTARTVRREGRLTAVPTPIAAPLGALCVVLNAPQLAKARQLSLLTLRVLTLRFGPWINGTVKNVNEQRRDLLSTRNCLYKCAGRHTSQML
jgi:hypothetical protein